MDDGSAKDRTAEIADEYERKDPGICRAIHQENKGHGGAVNTGLANATGIFVKVVDSDDWVNEEAYREVLETLTRFVYGDETLDMLVTNFVYEKQGAKRKKVMNYRTALPQNEVIGWDKVKLFMVGQYILMHSVIYLSLIHIYGKRREDHGFHQEHGRFRKNQRDLQRIFRGRLPGALLRGGGPSPEGCADGNGSHCY